MAFDVEGAKQAGYSDAEIADHLATTTNFDAEGARKAGYSDQEILAQLAKAPQKTGLEGHPEEAFQADYAQHPIALPKTGYADYREPGTDLTDIEPRDGAVTRIVGAIDEGFRKGASAGTDIQGQPLLTGLMRQGGGVLGAVGGAFGQGAYELGNLWSPEAGRDAFMAGQIIPNLGMAIPKLPGPRAMAAAPRISPMMEAFDRAEAARAEQPSRPAPPDPAASNIARVQSQIGVRDAPPPSPDMTATPAERAPGFVPRVNVDPLTGEATTTQVPTDLRLRAAIEAVPPEAPPGFVPPGERAPSVPPGAAGPATIPPYAPGRAEPTSAPPTQEPLAAGNAATWRSADHDYPVTTTGVEQTHTDGRVYAQVWQPDGTVSYVPKDELVPGASAPVADPAPPPGTSAYAKYVASAYYDIADKSGGTLTPQFTNKLVDAVSAADKQTKAGKIFAGQNVVSRLAEDVKALRDEPLTLRAAQEVDEAMGDVIDEQFTNGRLSKTGRKVAQMQSDFRDMIENAGEGDITGGTAGFDALGPARKAWSQARKMDDLERIQERADLTDNPATSVRTQIRTLITNKTKSRGYSPEEIAALKEAADRGVVGGALHVFGSRLVPLVAGGLGMAHGGPVSAAIFGGAAHGVSAGLRAGATNIARRRLNRAIGTLGEGIPPNPLFNPDAAP